MKIEEFKKGIKEMQEMRLTEKEKAQMLERIFG